MDKSRTQIKGPSGKYLIPLAQRFFVAGHITISGVQVYRPLNFCHNASVELQHARDRSSSIPKEVYRDTALCEDAVGTALPRLMKDLQAWVNREYRAKWSLQWHAYGVEKSDVLCWCNCWRASEILSGLLSKGRIEAVPHSNDKMPALSLPYVFRRGEDPIITPHVAIIAERGSGRVLIDPTFMQFVMVLVGQNKERGECVPQDKLKKYFPSPVLVVHEREIREACRNLAEGVEALGFGIHRSEFMGSPRERVAQMQRHFLEIYDLSKYQKL